MRWSTRPEKLCSRLVRLRVERGQGQQRIAVATVPRGNPASSGATACVRAALWPGRMPTGSPAMMRRMASSLGTASVKLSPVFCFSPS